jgi:hypothetical protein
MIKWTHLCRRVLATMIKLPVAFDRAAYKPIAVGTFTLLRVPWLHA